MSANTHALNTLGQAIERTLRNAGGHAPVASVTERRSDYESSFGLKELLVEFEDGSRQTLMLKEVGPAGLSSAARLARARLPHDPRREPRVYEFILAPAELGPRLHGVVEDEQSGYCGLLIEKVEGIELYQVGDLSIWQEAARWLARMHARFAGRAAQMPASIPLLQYDRSNLGADFALLLESPDPTVVALAQDLAVTYGRVLDVLYAWPQTFLHGDFYASNILVVAKPAGEVIVPVDWELAGVGPSLLDLAALTCGRWTALQRLAIASSYHATWCRTLGTEPTLSSLLFALDCARLVVALRWLAAPSAWQPPLEHSLDWLKEASDLSMSLGLLPERR